MKKNSIIVGLVFILIGVVIIAWQLEFLDFSIFYSVFKFVFRNLPKVISVMLIVIGINIIFSKYRFVKFITWVAFFAAIIILSQLYQYNQEQNYNVKREADKSINSEMNDDENINHFEIDKKDETLYGELDANLGVVKININSTDDKLIKGNINGLSFKEPVVNYKDDNKKAKIKLKAPDFKDIFNKDNIKNIDSNLYLNEDILWDINLNLGVADTEIDISNLQVEDLKLNGGAGDFKLIIGERQEEIEIDINAGASNIDIYVPENSGVKVKSTNVLSSFQINGIEMVKDNKHYVTENFDDAENKIKIDVKMGAGNITINAEQ